MLLQGKVSQLVKGMRQSVTKRKLRGSKKKAILAAAAYLYRNKAFMKYDEYLAAGLPIATGAVEGACKNLVKDRMERSGMRWTEAGAEAVLMSDRVLVMSRKPSRILRCFDVPFDRPRHPTLRTDQRFTSLAEEIRATLGLAYREAGDEVN